MKKFVFAVIAIATFAFASCGSSTTSVPATTDSAKVSVVDTTKAKADTSHSAVIPVKDSVKKK
jgi:hypothetical protein